MSDSNIIKLKHGDVVDAPHGTRFIFCGSYGGGGLPGGVNYRVSSKEEKVDVPAMPESIQRDIVQAALRVASGQHAKANAVAVAEIGMAAYAVTLKAIESS